MAVLVVCDVVLAIMLSAKSDVVAVVVGDEGVMRGEEVAVVVVVVVVVLETFSAGVLMTGDGSSCCSGAFSLPMVLLSNGALVDRLCATGNEKPLGKTMSGLIDTASSVRGSGSCLDLARRAVKAMISVVLRSAPEKRSHERGWLALAFNPYPAQASLLACAVPDGSFLQVA